MEMGNPDIPTPKRLHSSGMMTALQIGAVVIVSYLIYKLINHAERNEKGTSE